MHVEQTAVCTDIQTTCIRGHSFLTYHKHLIFHTQNRSLAHDAACTMGRRCNITAQTGSAAANAVRSRRQQVKPLSSKRNICFFFLRLVSKRDEFLPLCRSSYPRCCLCVSQNQTFMQPLWKPLTVYVTWGWPLLLLCLHKLEMCWWGLQL